jgi:preprotein translocase subunit YajC
MEDITRDLFVSIAAFAAIFGIVYVFLMTRHRERMSMLEKGIDPAFFGSKAGTKSHTLRIGMLLIGISLGILLGSALKRAEILSEPVAFLSMIFLLGGTSLVLYFFIERKMKP